MWIADDEDDDDSRSDGLDEVVSENLFGDKVSE